MTTTYSTYPLGAVASRIFLAIENMPHRFSAHVHYRQTAGWIRIPLGTEVGLDPGDIVLDGDPLPPHGKGHSSRHFYAHVCCGQTTEWIKVPPATDRLGPCDIVLDGPGSGSPKERGTAAPTFRPLLWPLSTQSRILPRQCAAGGCRGNPTG